jgi:hypothetical protein
MIVAVLLVATFASEHGSALGGGSGGGSGGLTLRRYNNTAFVGVPLETTVTSSLERVESSTKQPGGMLLSGRLAPPWAGRYGFQLTFVPALDFPSVDAYARLWVDDHLL